MSDQRTELAGAAIIGAAASASAVALLGTSAWLLARAAELPPVLTLTVAAVMVRFFALGRAVFRYGERVTGHDAALRGLTSLRVRIYQRLERLAPIGLSQFSRGDLLSRLVGDVDAAMDLPLRVVLPWVQAGIVLLASVAMLAWILPAAAVWIAVLGLVALLLIPWIASALASAAERRMAGQRAALTEGVVTALTASADLLAYGAVDTTLDRIRAVDQAGTRLIRRESISLGLGGGMSIAVQGAAVVGALLIGIPALRVGTITAPWLAVLALMPLALFDVLGGLPSAALALQRLRGAADRLSAIEDAVDPVHEPAQPVAFAARAGLRVRDLSASWTSNGGDVLAGIDLDLPVDGRLSIVGPSGSGKSTLAAVLMGLLDYRGSVSLDDCEVRLSDHDELRSRIGLLAQRGHVFDTTIDENIRLGRPADAEQVWDAVDRAEFGATVRGMPAGLQTMAGTFGTSISAGEAQRLSIARLFLQPRELLILDEPTEHLDPSTAAGIEATLEALVRGRSRILITHRLMSIPADEQVIVLQGGRITESGTARTLRDGSGWFADRYRQQSAEADLIALIDALPIGRGVAAEHSLGR